MGRFKLFIVLVKFICMKLPTEKKSEVLIFERPEQKKFLHEKTHLLLVLLPFSKVPPGPLDSIPCLRTQTGYKRGYKTLIT